MSPTTLRALALNGTLKPSPARSEYLISSDTGWSDTTARAAAQNLHTVARALASTPLTAPPS